MIRIHEWINKYAWIVWTGCAVLQAASLIIAGEASPFGFGVLFLVLSAFDFHRRKHWITWRDRQMFSDSCDELAQRANVAEELTEKQQGIIQDLEFAGPFHCCCHCGKGREEGHADACSLAKALVEAGIR